VAIALSGSLYSTDAALSASLYGASAVASASLYGAGAALSASAAATLAGVATASAAVADGKAVTSQAAIDLMETQVVIDSGGRVIDSSAYGSKIVDNQAHHRFCQAMNQANRSCKLKTINGARHELLFEKDAYRNTVLAATFSHLNQDNSTPST